MELNFEQIREILPHRSPFLLIDRITDLVPGESAEAVKCVSGNEPFFQGHFPEKAVMPGVLILEALAQTGAVAILSLPETGLFRRHKELPLPETGGSRRRTESTVLPDPHERQRWFWGSGGHGGRRDGRYR